MIIPQAKYAYNGSVNRTTGRSPFEIIYGMHPRGACEIRDLVAMEYRSGR